MKSSPYNPIPEVDLPGFVIEKQEAAYRSVDRRGFLKLTGLAGGGLALAFFLGGRSRAEAASMKGGSVEFEPNGFIQITDDGSIIIYAKNPEVGQGIKTSFPMIIAEELDVPWESVEVRQSTIDHAKYGPQFAGGSLSIVQNWDRLRQAGAVARAMLVTAAAHEWGVAESECGTDQGNVVHEASERSLSYAELASKAAALPVPGVESVTLKERGDYHLLGKRITGVDNNDLVRGKPLFGIDQRVPGMKYAVFVKGPAFRAKPVEANFDEIKALSGVVDAFFLEGNGVETQLMPGVAIVANSTWQAFQAEKKLRVTWNEADASTDDWSAIVEKAGKLTDGEGDVQETAGDVDAAFAGAAKTVEVKYSYPFLSHANMEPQNCTASYRDGELEVWAPSQTPQGGRGDVAKLLDIPEDKVNFHQLRIGGGFGRRLMNDYVCEVSAISKRIGAPVKLQWTREADMAHDFYRVGGFHSLKGAIDESGKMTGWKAHFVTFTTGEGENPEPVRGGGMGVGAFSAPEVKNYRFTRTMLPLKVPCGWWRAPGSCSVAFATQSFLHEVSVAAGRDHLEFLLELVGESGWQDEGNLWALNTARAAKVIKMAAEKGDWGKPLPKGRGRGLAFFLSHAGHFAEVAEVTVDASNKVTVDRVVVACDVGFVVNPSGGENQIEGSVVDALSTMAGQEITFSKGRVQQSNFHDYPLLRMPNHPKVEIHFAESEYPPTGLGEPAFPPAVPAICNAIFDATGTRIRQMPISKAGFTV